MVTCLLQMTEDTYAVVSFLEEQGSLFVIPKIWMVTEKSCFWPPFATDAKITKAVKNREPPQTSWSQHSVRLLTIQGLKISMMINEQFNMISTAH
jgi:hypothetical protein